MKSITVPLKERAYRIQFGPLGSEFIKALRSLGFSDGRVLIVTDRSLEKVKWAPRVLSLLKKNGYAADMCVLPSGEQNKTLGSLKILYRNGFQFGLDRKSLVIALGGGVITDMAGFFAATYMRGIRYVSIPTTLLAMVDASVGGKTGVDLEEGKNLVGSFWQPSLVWMDLNVLSTLPKREWRTGFAEIIKYGVIRDKKFFQWLEKRVRKNARMTRWKRSDIAFAVHRSVQIKADVVGKDERETPLKGGREILNFGHTIGHALEAATGYKTMSHGEAISVGMAVVGEMSLELGLWSKDEQLQLVSLLNAAGLPLRFPKLSPTQKKRFWASLNRDKKHVGGQLRFVIAERLGRVRVQSAIPLALVHRVANQFGMS